MTLWDSMPTWLQWTTSTAAALLTLGCLAVLALRALHGRRVASASSFNYVTSADGTQWHVGANMTYRSAVGRSDAQASAEALGTDGAALTAGHRMASGEVGPEGNGELRGEKQVPAVAGPIRPRSPAMASDSHSGPRSLHHAAQVAGERDRYARTQFRAIDYWNQEIDAAGLGPIRADTLGIVIPPARTLQEIVDQQDGLPPAKAELARRFETAEPEPPAKAPHSFRVRHRSRAELTRAYDALTLASRPLPGRHRAPETPFRSYTSRVGLRPPKTTA